MLRFRGPFSGSCWSFLGFMENSGDQQRASILHAMAQLPKRLCLAERVAKVETQKPKRVDVANVEILEEV